MKNYNELLQFIKFRGPLLSSRAMAVAVLFLLGFSVAFSQPASHNDVGIYIGPNFSNIDIQSPIISADSRTGFQAGFFYRGGNLFYGQMGLQYQLIKTNFAIPDSSGGSNDDVVFRRLQLPLYAGLNLIPVLKGIFNIRAYAGPVISYDIDVLNNTLDFTPSDFNRFRLDGTFGAGVDVLIFSFDAGYTLGINNLFHKQFDAKGNYAFVNVGLRF
ncbi:MAG: PorT family protein [Chitinophagales bacterium]|nr:PorT family protein [Chitinophagales bacterium]